MVEDDYVDTCIIQDFIEKGLVFASQRRKKQPLFQPTKFKPREPETEVVPSISKILTRNMYVNVGSSK